MKNLILFTTLATLLTLTSCGNKIDKFPDGLKGGDNGNSNYDKSISYQGNMNEVLSNTLSECNIISILRNTTNASISFNNNNFQYLPNQNYVGIDDVIVNCDNKKYLLVFNIMYKNHDPSSSNITLNLNEDESKSFQISFSDIDNNVNNINFRTPPTNGNISGSFNSYTYTPNLNFNGSDFTEFQIVDSGGGFSPWYQITFNVNSINDTPSTNNKSYTFVEDSSNNQIVLDGVDPDSINLTFGTTLPSNGTLSCNNDNCLYTPNLNFNGNDSFNYTVSDGNTSSTSTISITVSPVNDSPTSNNISISTNEDTPVNIVLQGSDVDSAISYSTNNPTNGVLSCNNENCTYTPNSNFNGSDSFNYTVSDGSQSSTSVVNITVLAIQDAPVAINQSLNLNEDSSLNFTLQGTDGDNDPLSYIVVTQPSNGTLNCTNENCTYIPNSNFNGSDSLSFKVNDGTVDSNVANVNFSINSINDLPVSNNNDIDVNRNSTNNSIILSGTDADGDSLTYIVVTQPSNGTLNCSNQVCDYTPNSNYVGSDSLSFKVNDGNSDSNIATINIDVLMDNTAPISQNQSLTFLEDSSNNSITLVSNDNEGDTLTFILLTQPLNGTLNCTNENCTYTPNSNFNGSDSFTFKSNDGEFDSNVSTINITVTPQQDNPVANDLNLVLQEDSLLNFQLSGSDADNDPLTYIIETSPINGTLNCSNNNCTYTSNSNYNGNDSFTYKVNDGTNDSNIATVNFTINPENDSPSVTNSFSINVSEDSSVNISSPMINNSFDIDGDTLTYEIVSSPSNGLISGTHPNLIYTPNSNYVGNDSFIYRVYDGSTYSNNSTVTIIVTPLNDVPVANDINISINEDTTTNFNLDCNDLDGDSLTYITSNPSNGSINCTSNNCDYTPNLNYTGNDSFTYVCNDGNTDSNQAIVSINITNLNDAPIVSDLSLNTNEDNALNFSLQGSDPENDTLSFSIVSNPNNGTLNCTNNNCLYTPNLNYNGSDSFTYKSSDGQLESNIATGTININPVNDNPISSNMNISTNLGNSINFTLNATDIDGDTLSSIITNSVNHGIVSCNGLDCTYTPNLLYFGSDSFTYKVNDGNVDSNESIVNIEVILINNTPVAQNNTISTIEDNSVAFELECVDLDLNTWTYTVENTTTNGSLNCSNEFCNYSPNPNFNGNDSLTFKCNDGFADSNTATITINVSSVQDPPIASSFSETLNEDNILNFILICSDNDGDSVIYNPVQPTNGSLTCSNENCTYTPNTNFNGSDSFTYTCNDGTVDSNIANVLLTINPINDEPIANDSSININEDTPSSITLNGFDVDGDILTYIVVSLPTNGSLTCSNENCTYTPNTNFNGSDSFTYKVNDGNIDSNTATISINISNINDEPIAQDINESIDEDNNTTFNLICNDLDNDILTYNVENPSNGTINCSVNTCTYYPNNNYNGNDNFTYTCNDGTVNSNVATINISINPIQDIPIANDISTHINEDTPSSITLDGSDVDGDSLTYIVVTQPTNGSLTCNNESCTYTPNTNFNGNDSFTYKVNDGTVDSNIANVSIIVDSTNDIPISYDLSTNTNEDINVSFSLNCDDSDGDSLTYNTLQASNGNVSCTINNCTYTPDANFNGSDSFTYTCNDGTVDSNTSTVSITVNAVNDAPVSIDSSEIVNEDDSLNLILNANDVDGDVLTYVIESQPNNGSLLCNNSSCQYQPNLNFNGSDSFSFKVNDGNVDSNISTVSITVSPINDIPTSNNQTLSLTENTSISFTINENDNDGDSLSFVIDSNVVNGNITGTYPNFTYIPNNSFVGQDSLEYHLNDGTTNSSTYTITFNVEQLQGNGLNAHYFNYDSSGLVYIGSEIVPTVDFNWGSSNPYSGLTPEYFGVRYEGFVRPEYSETYTFYTNSDDGVRLWVNGQLIVNEWTNQSVTEHSGTILLNAQEYYHIVLEYYEESGDNEVHLSWSSNSQTKEIVPQNKLFSGKMVNSSFRDNYTQLVINRTRTNLSNNYPVLIDLTNLPSTEDFWNNVQSNGDDILITVNSLTNRVPVEITSFDKVNKKGQIWIKSDLLQENVNNVFIHYNNSTTADITKESDSSTYGTYNVWSNGFVLVTHMEESSGLLFDSSHGDLVVDYGSPLYNQTSASTSLGGAVGVNIPQTSLDYFNLNTNLSRFNMTDEISLQTWLKISSTEGHALVIKKQGAYHHHGAYSMMMDKKKTKTRVQSLMSYDEDIADSNINSGEWTLVTTTYSNANNEFRFYKNNLSNGITYTSAVPSSNSGTIEIGGTNERTDHYFSGYLDEVRISNKVRDLNWIKNDYDSMKNNNLWFFYLEYQE